MSIYDDMQVAATDMLSEFKQGIVTLSRTTKGTIDPNEPFIPVAGVTTVYTLNATVKAVSMKFISGQTFIDGTTILATDKEVTCAIFAIEPEPGDIVTIDGAQMSIVKVMRIPGAGTAIVFKLIVRG